MPPAATIGRYDVLRPFGAGEGRWLAFEPQLDRTVVLETTDAGAEVDAALRRVRAFAAVEDPALPAIHDIATIDGRVVVAREHVDGAPLPMWAHSAAGWRDIFAVGHQIARALAKIHAAGLALGSCTSTDIVIRTDGHAWITSPLLHACNATTDADRVALCEVLVAALRDANAAPPSRFGPLAPTRFSTTDDLARWLARDPANVRRRVALAVAGVVVVLAFATYVEARSATDRGCAGDRELAAVWNDDARLRVREAVLATGAAFAEDVAESVDGALDRWASEWIGVYDDACEAAKSGGAGHELHTRMRCLGDRREGFSALLSVIERADDTVVRNAVEAAQGLESPRGCLAAEADEYTPSHEAQALRNELAHVAALQGAGKYDDALARIEPVVGEAERLGDVRLEAEALHRRGMLEWLLGRPRAAEATFETCVGRAWVAGRDELAAFSWAQLVYVRGELLGDYAAAHRASRSAAATQARVGDVPTLAAEIESSNGTLAFREGRYLDAMAHYERALTARARAGPDDLRRAGMLTNLANSEIRAGRLDDALAHQREALELRRASLGEIHPETAQARETMAAIHHAKHDPDAALAELRRVHSIREQTLGPEHPLTIQALANVGAVLTDLAQWDEAAATLGHALAQTRRFAPDDHNVFFLLVNFALVAREQGDPATALQRCDEAERTLGPAIYHPERAIALHCQGTALADLDRHVEAIERLRLALEIREAKLGDDHELVARTATELGASLLALGRVDDARAQLRRADDIHARRGTPASIRADVHFQLARIAAADGDEREARERAERALAGYRADPGGHDDVARVQAWLTERRD